MKKDIKTFYLLNLTTAFEIKKSQNKKRFCNYFQLPFLNYYYVKLCT